MRTGIPCFGEVPLIQNCISREDNLCVSQGAGKDVNQGVDMSMRAWGNHVNQGATLGSTRVWLSSSRSDKELWRNLQEAVLMPGR